MKRRLSKRGHTVILNSKKSEHELLIIDGDTVFEECAISGNGFTYLFLFFVFYEGADYISVGGTVEGR